MRERCGTYESREKKEGKRQGERERLHFVHAICSVETDFSGDILFGEEVKAGLEITFEFVHWDYACEK